MHILNDIQDEALYCVPNANGTMLLNEMNEMK